MRAMQRLPHVWPLRPYSRPGPPEHPAAPLELLLECAAEGIYGIDLQGRFTFVNRSAAEMLARSPSDLVGHNAHEVVHHSHADGSPYPMEECPIFRAFRSGRGCRVDDEVLWRSNGSSFPASYSSLPLERAGVIEGAVVTFSDITERRRSEEALKEANSRLMDAATTDPLTGLPNRAMFSDRLNQALPAAAREGHEVAVLFIDVDHFKQVNDSLGHHGGDEVLVEVSKRLVAATSGSDAVVRLGGDEFAILLTGAGAPDAAVRAAEQVLESFQQSFDSSGMELFLSASVGVALLPGDSGSKTELLKHADLAMNRAKESGGGRFELYQPLMTVAARDRLRLEAELRRAIDEAQFVLRYQPQVDLTTGEVVAVEALVRWNHPDRGEVGPMEFIALAENTHLIVPIGGWVLAEACRQASLWRTQLPGSESLRVAVNVSAVQLTNPRFVDLVLETLNDAQMSPADLELEITESTLIAESGQAETTLRVLRSLGVRLAIDDFGTGYSSLSYLRRFPVDRLKVDKSFITGLCSRGTMADKGDCALIAATVNLAHALDLEAVAEGVETDEQREQLVAFGCDQGQGYLWTVPLLGDNFAEWYRRWRTERPSRAPSASWTPPACAR
ncbi:MAG: putative bifunctional diguanylate cyclase/phosphodiesterase [Acidimicrobiales bacterium]